MDATFNIAGKDYLSIDLYVTAANVKAVDYACDKYKAISNKINQVEQGGFFKEKSILGSVYVPVENYEQFAKSIKEGVTPKGSGSFKGSEGSIFAIMVGMVLLIYSAIVVSKSVAKLELKAKEKDSPFQRLKKWVAIRFPRKKKKEPQIDEFTP